MARIHKKLYKKGLNDLDDLDDVVIHLQSDILECELKWTLEIINTNKASGSDEILVDLFQVLKDDAMTVLHSI